MAKAETMFTPRHAYGTERAETENGVTQISFAGDSSNCLLHNGILTLLISYCQYGYGAN